MLLAAEHPFVSMAQPSRIVRDRSLSCSDARRGLTLLELIVVMAVLVALATMVVPILDNFAGESRMTATQQTLRRLQDIINNRYATDMKGYVFLDASNSPLLDANNLSLNKGLPVPHPTAAVTSLSGRNAYYPQLAFLFVNPLDGTQSSTASAGFLGWRGPYSSAGGATFPYPTQVMPNGNTAAQNGFYGSGNATIFGSTVATTTTTSSSVSLGWVDPAVIDAWGSPIVIQPIVTSSSSGPFNFTMSGIVTASYATSSLATTMTPTNSALVSAGPDGVLNTTDDVFIKIQ